MTLPSDPALSAGLSRAQPVQSPRTKRSVACNFCRAKKIRCNGDDHGPCANCLDRNLPCVSSSPARYRHRDRGGTNNDVAERLARVEALLKQQPSTPATALLSPSHDPLNAWSNQPVKLLPRPTDQPSSLSQFQLPPPPYASECHTIDSQLTPSTSLGKQSLTLATNPVPLAPRTSSAPTDVASTTFEGEPETAVAVSSDFTRPPTPYDGSTPEEIRERSSISSSETSNWEYHGPRSFLSICSKPGIQWVDRKTGSSSFNEAARSFTTYVTRRLKIERRLSTVRAPEPDPEAAWRYTQAYFDEALDSALGIVHRPWFEAQLRSYLDGTVNDSDPAWYALRNAIYASGCRIELSKSKTFLEANQTAWGWFENALAAHTEILYFRTSILGVQALTVMAYYSHNIGSPCLEYMLCTNALRLAVAKGLHRQAVSSWNSTELETTLRSCLFWAAYCLEKQIVSQSGRHSLIDDDDVNCQIPTQVPAGSTMNLQYFTVLIRLARLSSVVAKRLSTVRAFRQGAELLVRSVAELDEQLVSLKRSVDPLIFLDSPINLNRIPAGLTLQQAMYLRYGFYNITLDIHTALTYPWCRSMVGLTPHAALRKQLDKSTQMVAETCRSAILATEHIHFDANTPVPLSFFGPMYALINLFIYILQTPQQSRIQPDLALMDVAAGYFARMQFATDSEISFSFAKELAALAHEAAARWARRYSDSSSLRVDPDPSRLRPDMSDSMNDRNVLEDDLQCDDPTASYVNPFFDLELENWSTFLPTGFDDKVMDFSVV